MTDKEIAFRHFAIDESDTERIIEMWNHFHPEDDPQPVPGGNVLLKGGEIVSIYQLFLSLPQLIFKVYWWARFYVCGLQYKTMVPVDLLYEHYLIKIGVKEQTPIEWVTEDDENKKTKKKKK